MLFRNFFVVQFSMTKAVLNLTAYLLYNKRIQKSSTFLKFFKSFYSLAKMTKIQSNAVGICKKAPSGFTLFHPLSKQSPKVSLSRERAWSYARIYYIKRMKISKQKPSKKHIDKIYILVLYFSQRKFKAKNPLIKIRRIYETSRRNLL